MNKNKDLTKQKNDLFKSIMKNPKLARTLQDGLSSPLGSTKREQAKSILSIMKKAKGVNMPGFDAMGGAYGGDTARLSEPEPQKNYGNMMIFPAAPKLKSVKKADAPQQQYNGMGGHDGQGGLLDTIKTNISNLFGSSNNNTNNSLNTNYSGLNTNPFQFTPSSSGIDFSKMGLTLNPEQSTKGLSVTNTNTNNNSNAKINLGGAAEKVLNGVIVPKAQQTLNTDPNQSIFNPGYNTINPPKDFPNLGLKISQNPTGKAEEIKKQNKLFAGDNKIKYIPGYAEVADTVKNNVKNTPSKTESIISNSGDAIETKGINPDQNGLGNLDKSQVFNKEDTTKNDNTKTSGYSNNVTDAVKNFASFMNTDPSTLTSTNIKDAANEFGIDAVVNALIPMFMKNEGGSLKGVQNNPGNIKYTGLPGQVDSGVKAADGGTFASYATPADGQTAMASLLKNIINGGTSYGDNPTIAQVINGWTNSGSSSSNGSSITSLAQNAVDNNYGAANFALGFADEKFGGSLDQYVDNLDKKLRSDFGLEELETQLSDLKSMKENFIPTLTSYVSGKDKYLKVIDKMISRAEDNFMSVDMSDPQASNSYRNYMNYLYTLKGRQSERYGNYLNSAISDYNAQVTKATEDYKDVYDRYESALTRGSTIAQSEYNNLVTRMNSLYTELQNAPINEINLQTAQQQLDQNNLTLAQNALAQYMGTDKDYMKKVGDYTDYITDKDEKLDLNKVSDGLSSLFTENDLQGGNNVAMTKAIERAMMKTLSADNSQETVSKLQNMITSLASDPQYAQYGSALNSAMSSKIQELTSDYVLGKIGEIKDASKDLVKGGWFSKSGLEDKESWINNYKKSLPETFLNSLYNTFANNIQPGSSYAENPMNYYRAVFSGATDEENAKNLAARMAISS